MATPNDSNPAMDAFFEEKAEEIAMTETSMHAFGVFLPLLDMKIGAFDAVHASSVGAEEHISDFRAHRLFGVLGIMASPKDPGSSPVFPKTANKGEKRKADTQATTNEGTAGAYKRQKPDPVGAAAAEMPVEEEPAQEGATEEDKPAEEDKPIEEDKPAEEDKPVEQQAEEETVEEGEGGATACA